MTQEKQQSHFETELNCLIDRFKLEYNLTYASAIGIMMVVIDRLSSEANKTNEDKKEEQ